MKLLLSEDDLRRHAEHSLPAVRLEHLANPRRQLSFDDRMAAIELVSRYDRRIFVAMISAAPPERARRLRAILKLADRAKLAMRCIAPLRNRS